ncbi:MAG: nucleotide pyrophosphohydrolase [Candidatus Omnitrophica bacterium]|jgi:NTP pyrophosphatase (non-canonical NTP hydrolase)|nr:nucleotide pyrophosphohydrolase [Candidatus Omnitrophota bacterium]
MSEVREVTEKIRKFRDDRDWMQFHDPKNMAVSIILEASELLEHFQWKTTEEVEKYAKQNKLEIQDEIADIALYLFELADNIGVDLIDAMNQKLTKNEKKYPVEKAKGKHVKYDKL